MKGDERYNVYSCSEVITCVAALKLWEKGLFSLEDKLSEYMPEFKEMTVRDGDLIKKAEKLKCLITAIFIIYINVLKNYIITT